MTAAEVAAVGLPGLPGEAIRGITISTHGSGQDWGTDVMPPTVARIAELGAGWIATHPYARIRGDGSVAFRAIDPANPPEYLVRPIREAHARGLKVLIKPHLAYWGSPFSWRGEIAFEDAARWQRFWTDYRRWIVAVAAACRAADGFAVGTELDRTLAFEDEWRGLIADVRAVTPAALTYAANWTDHERVTFWDAVDVIGIQAYFPIADEPDADLATARAGWARRMGELHGFARKWNRNIVFTELGYNRAHLAGVRPWEYHSDGPTAEPTQLACMQAALEAIEAEPAVLGAFLWKWFPGDRPNGRNFRLATPGMLGVIRGVWRRD